jgi:hypothetical protein
MFQSNVKKVCHVIIVQGIEKDLPFPAFFYQGHIPQSPELVRHRRFSQVKESSQITDAHLPSS